MDAIRETKVLGKMVTLRVWEDVHQNKIQISAGIINLELSKGKEIKGPVLAAEILIDPVFSGKEKAFCLSSILIFSTRD